MEEEAGEERMEQVIAGTLDVEGETGRESRTPDEVAMGG